MFALPVVLAGAIASTPMNADVPGGLYMRSDGVGKMVPVPHEVAHRGSFIEMYSPNITTVYSQVFWTMMEEVPLDPDFVAKWKGKTIAVTGYECDSTRMLPDGTEEHVPIYEQYNHHHAAWVIGANARMVDLGPGGRAGTHGNGRWEVRQRPKTTRETAEQTAGPSVQSQANGNRDSVYMVDGNGGEYRMSLHGTHRGTAMLLDSPSSFRITPMMINTKHPEGKAPVNIRNMLRVSAFPHLQQTHSTLRAFSGQLGLDPLGRVRPLARRDPAPKQLVAVLPAVGVPVHRPQAEGDHPAQYGRQRTLRRRPFYGGRVL